MTSAGNGMPLSYFTTWLARGERGLSSEAIVEDLTGERIIRHPGNDHPRDPADLRRCMDLLAAHDLAALSFPGTLEQRSPQWAALVAVWDDLTALLREEMAEGTGRAPRTFARMREVIGGVA